MKMNIEPVDTAGNSNHAHFIAETPGFRATCHHEQSLTNPVCRLWVNFVHRFINRKRTSSSESSQQVCIVFLHALLQIA